MILTHSDELDRLDSDDPRLPLDPPPTSSDEVTGTGPTMDEQTSGASRWDNLAFKETRATIDSSGTGSVTITTAVATADSPWFDKSQSFGRGRRSSQKEKRKSSQPAGQLGANMQELEILESDIEKTRRDEGRQEIIPLNPIDNSSSITERPSRVATISTWEAAWNVTNAIQVPNIITPKEIMTDHIY